MFESLVEEVGGSEYETEEQRIRAQRSAGEFGVELSGDKEFVIRDFCNLHALASVVMSREVQPLGLKLCDELRVNLVPMSMSFIHHGFLAVQFEGQRFGVLDDSHTIA